MAIEIPASVLGVTVIGGVVLIVGGTWWLGWSKTPPLDEARVRRRLQADTVVGNVDSISFSDDRTVALAHLESGTPVLVLAFGDRTVSRVRPAVRWREHADRITLRLADDALPKVRFRLANPDDRTRWRTALAS